jgi:hypothetical protein
LLYLFYYFEMVAAPSASAAKDLRGEDVRTTDSLSSLEPPVEVEAALAHETGVLDNALALGREGTTKRDVVCGLLTECLQDISSAVLMMSYLFARCWVFTFSFFCTYAVKLTKDAETIITEDSGASLRQRIAELEAQKNTLQHVVDNGIEDYDMMLEGNKSLLAECDDFRFCCEDLQVELVEVHSDAKKQIADLEAKVESAEAHSVDIAATDERRLKDFEDELIRDLVELLTLYVPNAQAIGGLCSPMHESEPLAVDYLQWLSIEISGLPDMFGGVNENFATTAVKGALAMAGDPVDLEAMQDATVSSSADILPTGQDVRRVVCAVVKNWWHSFGYNYVLATIHAKHEKVLAYL